MDGHDGIDKESQELQVRLRVFARRQKIHACVGTQRPVIVLTRTVHACKWLLVQEHAEVVLACNFLHEVHEQ